MYIQMAMEGNTGNASDFERADQPGFPQSTAM